MNKNIFLAVGFISIFFLASCSKEKQIASNLTNQAGRWNIDNFKTTVTTTGFPAVVTDLSDVGYMYFFDNNDGHIIYIYDVGVFDFIEFEWTATVDGVIIEYSNEEFEFVFTTNEQDRLVLYRSLTVPLTDTTSTTTETEYELLRIE